MEIVRRIDNSEAAESRALLTKQNRQELSKGSWHQIALAKDELVGQGFNEGKKAKGDRRQELEQQIKIWKALQEKLDEKLQE